MGLFAKILGVPGKLIEAYEKNEEQKETLEFITHGIKSSFFQPYNSATDFALRGANILTAPIAFILVAPVITLASLYFVVDACLDLAIYHNRETAAINATNAGLFLVGAVAALLVAVMSPLINLVDLIGSVVTTLDPDNSQDDIHTASCSPG